MRAVRDFVTEMRRRRVFRVIALYVVGAWIVLQVSDVLFPAWGIPDSGKQLVLLAALVCLPVALIFG